MFAGFDSENITLPLEATSAAAGSRFFSAAHADGDLDSILFTQPVTMNNHHSGVSPDAFMNNSNLTAMFKQPLTINHDRKGNAFVSTVEAVNYPIYATQWHPEKPLFEWWADEVINHSYDSVRANGFTQRFFVNEARKNARSFPSPAAEDAALIYNYNPVYTGLKDPEFEQCYFFD